ncbi:MAG: hypothetical protein LIP28_01000 [Deltaproteobacteria bacterium]|nr:hypothetical protein [Deltaproteobacteria bacterium]
MKQTLTVAQKERFKRLTLGLHQACTDRDLASAKAFAYDIRELAKATNQNARWLSSLNVLSETAIECGDIPFAIRHLEHVVKSSSETTRIRIEAYSLLAVAYIRSAEYAKSKDNIRLAIKNIRNIQSEKNRKEFYEAIVLRLEEEAILAGAKAEGLNETFDIDTIQKEAVSILVSNEGEAQILARIGNSLPDASIDLFNDFRNSTLLQIPRQEILQLPPPNVAVPESSIGRKALSAFKRVLWITLCDQNDELYKAWSGGLALLYDKKLLPIAVAGAFANFQLGSKALVVYVTAYLFKIGCRTFCEAFAPETIMKRKK